MVLIMRYFYGSNDSYYNGAGRTCSVPQLASIIKKDVEYGKWNLYDGGKANSVTAKCRYQRKGFAYHSYLLIFGTEEEFKRLEELIKDTIEVIPRQYH